MSKSFVGLLDTYVEFTKEDREEAIKWEKQLATDSRTVSHLASGHGGGMGSLPIQVGNVEVGYANGITLYNPNTGKHTIVLNPNGDAFFGKNVGAPAETSMVVFSNAQKYNAEQMGDGDLLLGDNSATKANMLWDRSAGQLKFRYGTTVGGTLGAGGLDFSVGSIGGWNFNSTTLYDDASTIVLDSSVPSIKVATNKVVLDSSGITAIAGTIGGWTIGSTTISDDQSTIVLNSGNRSINVNSGSVILSSSGITAIAGAIGGWTIGATTLYSSNITLDDGNDKITVGSGVILDGASSTITVGSGSPYLYIDGGNTLIKSSNFSAGVSGFQIDTNKAEFENIEARGKLAGSVFEVSDIQAVAGTFMVSKSAAVIHQDFTTPSGVGISGTLYAKNDLQGNSLLAANDIIYLKRLTSTGVIAAYLTVNAVGTNSGTYTTYTVTLSSGSASTSFKAGTAIADMGASGDGIVYISADGHIGSSANISITKHAGEPWSSETLMTRLGNLNGAYGAVADVYGIGIGDYSGSNYLSYNADGASTFLIKAGSGNTTINASGITIATQSVYTSTYLQWHDGTYRSAYITANTGDDADRDRVMYLEVDAASTGLASAEAYMTQGVKGLGVTEWSAFTDTNGTVSTMKLDYSGVTLTNASTDAKLSAQGTVSGNILKATAGIQSGSNPGTPSGGQLLVDIGTGTGQVAQFKGDSLHAGNAYISVMSNHITLASVNALYEIRYAAGSLGYYGIIGGHTYSTNNQSGYHHYMSGYDSGGNPLTYQDVYSDTNYVYDVHGASTRGFYGQINGAAGTYRWWEFASAGSGRWRLSVNSTAESGSNAGSDFAIYRYSDAAGYLGMPFYIIRSDGAVYAEQYLKVGAGESQTGTFTINKAAGNARDIGFQSSGTARWVLRTDNASESGSNAGSDLIIRNYTDAGSGSNLWKFVRSSGDIIYSPASGGDLYTDSWQNWYSSSTVTGWSSFTTTRIYYKKIGRMVFLHINLVGTSNTTTAQITLPYANSASNLTQGYARTCDNGTWYNGIFSIPDSGTVCAFYPDVSGTGWTASGNKQVRVSLMYMSAT